MRLFCSICKDMLIPYSEVHVTKCGHLYHEPCISTWIGQHKTCPQCRAKTSTTFRVFFDVERDSEADPNTLEHELESLSDKLRETEREKQNLQENYTTLMSIVDTMKECAESLTQKNDVLKSSVKALKGQVTRLTKENQSVVALEYELSTWKSKAQSFERIETILKGSADETHRMIAATPITEQSIKQLCIYISALKCQLLKMEQRNNTLIKENKEFMTALAAQIKKESSESEEIKSLRESNLKLQSELEKVKRMCEEIQNHYNKKEDKTEIQQDVVQPKVKKSFFDVDIDFDEPENASVQCIAPVREDKTISHWEKLVCAGPSRNSFSIQKSRFLNRRISCTTTTECSAPSPLYAFDGMGGRKKLRLGGPTPAEEFERIKKKKGKNPAPSFQHTKIIDFCQVEQDLTISLSE